MPFKARGFSPVAVLLLSIAHPRLDRVQAACYTLFMQRLFLVLGALCVLLLSLGGLWLLVREQRQTAAMQKFVAAGPATLAREDAAARALGIPLTPAAKQAPLPPTPQNAAPLYTQLTALLHAKPLGLPKYAEGMSAFHSYTPAQIAAVRRTLAARPDVMRLVHQAARRPQCVFVRDWSHPLAATFPEFRTQREAARLLETESYLLARDGKYSEAVATQALGFRVAEHAASDHVLIAYLVGCASESITLTGMQSILEIAGPNAAVAASVKNAVQTQQSHLSLRDAMAGETDFGVAIFGPMHAAEGQGVDAVLAAGTFPTGTAHAIPPSFQERQRLHALIDAWEADYLSRMCPLVAASDQPPAVRRAAYAALEAQVAHDSNDPAGVTHLFTDVTLPVFSHIDENATRTQARVSVTQAAAALMAQKAKTGAFPETLPAGLTDPYTNQPLNYRREGANGFVVYSVGAAGGFTGGKPGDKFTPSQVSFRYPALPPVPLPAE